MLILGIVISIAGSTLNMTIKEKSDLFSGSIFSRFSLRKKRPLAPSSEDGIPHIPQFEIVGMLGEGGMASVYLAKQVSTGREVAIKILATHLQSDSLWASRFLDEATRLAELSHPNIVPVFDWGNYKGTAYIVMEYMKGGDLKTKIKQGQLTIRSVIDIVRQVASGLDFAGEKGYVHRDIKPDNILFREDGSPCILDFGIAKKSSSNTMISSSGMLLGTGAYLSPEQANPKSNQLDTRSDLYSLGVVLYEMLTGKRPFEFEQRDPIEAFQLFIYAHINTSPPPLPENFSAFQPLMDKLLDKNPHNRFARGNELRAALNNLEKNLSDEILSYHAWEKHDVTVTIDAERKQPATSTFHSSTTAINSELVSPDTDSTSIPEPKVARYGYVALLLALIVYSIWIVNESEKQIPPITQEPVSETELEPESDHNVSQQIAEPEVVERVDSQEERVNQLTQSITSLKESEIIDWENQKKLVELYQEMLDLKPDNLDAKNSLDALFRDHRRAAEQHIASTQLDTAQKHIELVRLWPTSDADALSSKLESTKYQIEQEKQLRRSRVILTEQIQKHLLAATDASQRSLDELVFASKKLGQAPGYKMERKRIDQFKNEINHKYKENVKQLLDNNENAEALVWLSQVSDLPVTQETEAVLVEQYQTQQRLADQARSVEPLTVAEEPEPVIVNEPKPQPKVRTFGSF